MTRSLFDQTYIPLSLIAAGGMGEVFLARQTGRSGFEREVALKRIHGDLSRHPKAVRSFLEEARLVAAMSHPNIVHIFDVGRDGNRLFIAMEHVAGTDLRLLAEQATQKGRMIPLEHAVNIIVQVLEGLRYAHLFETESGSTRGVVHGDIGPNNILLTYDGVVKLVDFGLAAAEGLLWGLGGAPAGKLAYMSPEAVRGKPLDCRADLFSVGVLLYEITVGKRLFRVSSFESMRRVMMEPVPPPTFVRPGYPAALEMVVMRALEQARGDRFSSAEAMLEDLEAFAFDSGLRLSRLALGRYLRRTMDAKAESSIKRLADREVTGVGREPSPQRDDLSFATPPPSAPPGPPPRTDEPRPVRTRPTGSIMLDALRSAEQAMAQLEAAATPPAVPAAELHIEELPADDLDFDIDIEEPE